MLQILDFDIVLKNEVKKLLLDAQQSGNDELNSGRYIFEVQHAKLVVQICMSEKITGKLSLEFWVILLVMFLEFLRVEKYIRLSR